MRNPLLSYNEIASFSSSSFVNYVFFSRLSTSCRFKLYISWLFSSPPSMSFVFVFERRLTDLTVDLTGAFNVLMPGVGVAAKILSCLSLFWYLVVETRFKMSAADWFRLCYFYFFSINLVSQYEGNSTLANCFWVLFEEILKIILSRLTEEMLLRSCKP